MKSAFSTQQADHIAEGVVLPSGAKIHLGARGPVYFGYHATGSGNLPKRDQQQRTSRQDNELRAGVRRALIPHVTRTLRIALQTGAPRSGGSRA
jgi:hypothetical protein